MQAKRNERMQLGISTVSPKCDGFFLDGVFVVLFFREAVWKSGEINLVVGDWICDEKSGDLISEIC